MRALSLVLLLLILLIQYPMWLGKGGWVRVWDVSRQLQFQKDENQRLQLRNAGLEAEVRDLKQGFEAVEERARYELGMIRPDEVFILIPDKQVSQAHAAPASVAPQGTPSPVLSSSSPAHTASQQ